MTIEEMMMKAESADIVDLLSRKGFELEDGDYQRRMKDHPHVIVDVEQNVYMDYGSGKGGSPVDFMANLTGRDKETEARELISLMESGLLKTYSNPKAFKAPEANDTNKHVYAYLTQTKGIDGEVVNKAINSGNLYEHAQGHIGKNGEKRMSYYCVFAGKDGASDIRYAHVQSTYEQEAGKAFAYDVKNSTPDHGFALRGRNPVLFVHDNPIEAMSAATLEKMNGMSWKDSHHLALPVFSAVPVETYMQKQRGIQSVALCLGNDKTAQYHADRIAEELREKGYPTVVVMTEASFNELVARRRAENQQHERPPDSLFEEAPGSKHSGMETLEENEVEDRVFVLAYDPKAEEPYFVFEKTDGAETDMESFPTKEAAVAVMEDRIEEAELAEEMEH